MNDIINNKNRPLVYLLAALPVCVIILFYYFSVAYSIDIPWFDDIENIPYFLVNWVEAANWQEKWETIIRPNNEHRVLTARLIVLTQYWLTGGLNFRVLVFCGNLSVLVLFSFLAYSHLKQKGKWIYILPITFLIFNFQSYASTFMTIMSMQYQMVIVLSVMSFYFLAKGGASSFFLAILLAWIDTFSMGNGMMVWPSGVVLLLFQLRWRSTFLWILAGATAVFFYFYGHDFVQGNDKAFDYILQYPVRTFVAFFTMLGGDFDILPGHTFSKRMILPTLAGMVLFAVFVLWFLAILSQSPFWRRFIPSVWISRISAFFPAQTQGERYNAFWLGTLIYVFISMLLVVVFRTRFDPYIILWSTYKMYPAVLVSVVYLLVLQAVPDSKKMGYAIVCGVVSAGLWASTLFNYLPVVKEIAETREAFAFNQKRNGIGLGATKNTGFETMAAETFRKVKRYGIYNIPEPVIHPDELSIDLENGERRSDLQVDVQDMPEDVLHIAVKKGRLPKGKHYAILQSDANLYLFKVPKDGSSVKCPKGTIKSGRYRIGFWVVNTGSTTLVTTDNRINVF
jgi:hypothetical protein